MIIYPMKTVKIHSLTGSDKTITLGICDSFTTKFMGLMFKPQIDPNFGLLFTEAKESRINTAIHMFFMNFDISVLWLNKQMVVVDKTIARKWRPVYVPKSPAQYTIELHVDRFRDFSIGEQLELLNDG